MRGEPRRDHLRERGGGVPLAVADEAAIVGVALDDDEARVR